MTDKTLIDSPVTMDIISSVLESLGDKSDTGGHAVFIGQVRADNKSSKRVSAIEYSAYPSMVETEAEKIRKQLLSEYSDVKTIVIFHSTGIVKAGEISLFVLVSAGHRQDAFSACNKAVELIKSNLPVWKKEIFEENSGEW